MKAAIGILVLLCSMLLAAQSSSRAQSSIAFLHVSVLDLSSGSFQSDMTVIVSGNHIARVGKFGETSIPPLARVVDATGKFLIPGLWDMHAHWWNEAYLSLFVANGVTGIRQMWGDQIQHEWRKKIAEGSLIGPRMVIPGPIIDGPNSIWQTTMVATAAEARDAVRKQKEEGAEFIKVYGLLPRESFFAIAEECRVLGIPFGGHVPLSVSALEASNAGQKSMEHLVGVLDACSSREEELRARREAVWMNRPRGQRIPPNPLFAPITDMMLETYDEQKAAELFSLFKRNQTWQCPTLTVRRSVTYINDPEFRNDERMKYMPAGFKERWDPSGNPRFRDRSPDDIARRLAVFKKELEVVGAMHRAGVDILAGTDALNPYCFPGFSMHDELALLVEAGLSPFEALRTATVNPARFLGREKEFGTVEIGKYADLLLLDANPLENIRNTQKINTVILNGVLFDKERLNGLLARAEAMTRGK